MTHSISLSPVWRAKARAAAATDRLDSIDLLRGLVMIIMALDHVRDYLHFDSLVFSPTDLQRTTLPLFATRLVTHLCAPTFILLAGVSARLVAARRTRHEASRFLLTRGAWLVLLQMTLVRFAWNFDVRFRYNSSTILSTIGLCMIALAALLHLRPAAILAFALITIVGHNALDGVSFAPGSPLDVLWSFLHAKKLYDLGGGYSFLFLYPLIPWVGVIALGYCLGGLYDRAWSAEARRQTLMLAGVGSLCAFFALRTLNVYGDPVPWSQQATGAMTLASFFNLEKYPPSLLYLCLTLGLSLLLLAAFEAKAFTRLQPMSTFGRAALFYYVVHIFAVHAFALLVVWAAGFPWREMVFAGSPQRAPPLLVGKFGLGLGQTYAVWAAIVLVLYPACAWWSELKARSRARWWSSYV